jgi:hypothetical protein
VPSPAPGYDGLKITNNPSSDYLAPIIDRGNGSLNFHTIGSGPNSETQI